VKPLGSFADTLLGDLTASAASTPGLAGRIVTDALRAGGAGRIKFLDGPGDEPLMRSRIDADLGEVTLIVKDGFTHIGDLRRATGDLLPVLERNPGLDSLFVLYTGDLDDERLTVDFDPGPCRFLSVHHFVERLRTNTLHDVVAKIQADIPPRRLSHGQVAAVDFNIGEGIINSMPDEAPLRFNLERATVLPGDPVTFSSVPTPGEDVFASAEDVTVDVPGDGEERHAKHISARLDGEPEVGVRSILSVGIGDPVPDNLLEGEDAVVPATDIPPDGLDTEWTVSSSDLEFHAGGEIAPVESADELPGSAVRFEMFVPREGKSDPVKLAFTPIHHGTAVVQIRINVRKELYRMLTAEIVVAGPGTANAALIRRDVTVIRGDRIGLAPSLAAESLRLDVLQDGADAYVEGSGPDWSHPRTRTPWPASLVGLGDHLARVRAKADEFREQFDTYLNAIDHADLLRALDGFTPVRDWVAANCVDTSDEAKKLWEEARRSKPLLELAAAGRGLFDAVFPPETAIRTLIDGLEPGALLDINWTEGAAQIPDVPWTLMYALPPSDEPDGGVDPMGFLGLRFRIRYFAYPARGARTDTLLGAPDTVSTACCLFWGEEEELVKEVQHQREPEKAVKRIFVPPEEDPEKRKPLLLGLLKGPEEIGVLHMFCHYGKLKGEPSFRFGDTNEDPNVLSLADLQLITVSSPPLVFANACATSGDDAYHVHPIKQHMFAHGAAAFIGTEAKVPPTMASRFATAFLHLFDGRPGNEALTAGEAMTQTRLLLWHRYCNIGGIFYSFVNETGLRRMSKKEAGVAE
jgi:hypothetical protein